MAVAHRVAQSREHLRGGHGADLCRAKSARPVGDSRYRQFDDAMQPLRADLAAIGGDPARAAQIGGIDAAVPGDANLGKGAQRIVIGAEIACAKGADRRRACIFQQAPGKAEQRDLIR